MTYLSWSGLKQAPFLLRNSALIFSISLTDLSASSQRLSWKAAWHSPRYLSWRICISSMLPGVSAAIGPEADTELSSDSLTSISQPLASGVASPELKVRLPDVDPVSPAKRPERGYSDVGWLWCDTYPCRWTGFFTDG